MQGIKILATARALPSKIMDNHMLSNFVDTSDEWIRERTGIGQRYICMEEEGCEQLAEKAAKRALKKSGIAPEKIGFVIVATSSSDYDFPATACLVSKNLGLTNEVMSFDMTAACTGFVYGLNIIRGLLASKPGSYGILIGSEKLSRILDYSDRSSCILFGDGAGAAVIGLEDKPFFHKSWSDGDIDKAALSCYGVGVDGAKLKMDGKAVFKFAVKALKQGIDEILADANIGIEDIDYVICHQANARIIDHVKRKYKGQEYKFYENIENYGNTSAASIPIALDEMYEKNIIKDGMKVIMVGFGAGFTWSSALVEI